MDAINSLVTDTYARARTAAAPGPSEDGFNLGALADNFASALRAHETISRDAMTGGAGPQALVEALASSQLAVETVATLRDRVVEAYQEILRMPV